MKHHRFGLLILALISGLLAHPLVSASEDTAVSPRGAIERAESKRATALLDKAVTYLKENGPEKAFPAFSDTKGPFVNGPYYVFVVGPDGFMHANGGSHAELLGSNAFDLRDAA